MESKNNNSQKRNLDSSFGVCETEGLILTNAIQTSVFTVFQATFMVG